MDFSESNGIVRKSGRTTKRRRLDAESEGEETGVLPTLSIASPPTISDDSKSISLHHSSHELPFEVLPGPSTASESVNDPPPLCVKQLGKVSSKIPSSRMLPPGVVVNTGCWTVTEDAKLVEALNRLGFQRGSLQKISEALGFTRDYQQVKGRIRTLRDKGILCFVGEDEAKKNQDGATPKALPKPKLVPTPKMSLQIPASGSLGEAGASSRLPVALTRPCLPPTSMAHTAPPNSLPQNVSSVVSDASDNNSSCMGVGYSGVSSRGSPKRGRGRGKGSRGPYLPRRTLPPVTSYLFRGDQLALSTFGGPHQHMAPFPPGYNPFHQPPPGFYHPMMPGASDPSAASMKDGFGGSAATPHSLLQHHAASAYAAMSMHPGMGGMGGMLGMGYPPLYALPGMGGMPPQSSSIGGGVGWGGGFMGNPFLMPPGYPYHLPPTTHNNFSVCGGALTSVGHEQPTPMGLHAPPHPSQSMNTNFSTTQDWRGGVIPHEGVEGGGGAPH